MVEVEIKVEVELVAALVLVVLGVVNEVDKVDVEADVSVVGVVTGIEVDEVEIGSKPELVVVKSVLREVLSGIVSDGILELKKKNQLKTRNLWSE